MSRLSDETKVVYTPVLYDANRTALYEGNDYSDEECAIQEAHNQVSNEIRKNGFVKHVYAVIEKRITPIYY